MTQRQLRCAIDLELQPNRGRSTNSHQLVKDTLKCFGAVIFWARSMAAKALWSYRFGPRLRGRCLPPAYLAP